MRKFLLTVILMVGFGTIAGATTLFPFFTDVTGNYETLTDDGKVLVVTGKSMFGDLEATASFLNDVVPEDVTKSGADPTARVYVSQNRKADTEDTNYTLKVYAIYLVKRPTGFVVYYTESDAETQRNLENRILEGKL